MDQKPSPGINKVGLSTISDSSDARVDIVFIHGLQGHPEWTWTHKTDVKTPLHFLKSSKKQSSQSTVFWPFDLLSKQPKLEQARILTWGYNSQVATISEPHNQNTISMHGNNFMVGLVEGRKNDPSRPLIFVAHSLGGIVVKSALSKSKISQPPNLAIYQSTRGIIFLGTPHRGSDAAGWGLIVTLLAKFALPSSNDRILKGLSTSSEILDNLNTELRSMLDDGKFCIHSYFEERGMTSLYGMQSKVVPHDSAIIGHMYETTQGIDGNHLEICKFAKKTDSGYKAVSLAIEEYVTKIEHERRNRFSIVAISRKSGQLDLFICGKDGQVYTSWWTEGIGWPKKQKWKPLRGHFPAGAKVTAVVQFDEHLDLFVCGANGCVYTSWWTRGVNWSSLGGLLPEQFPGRDLLPSDWVHTGWQSIGGEFPGGSDVAAVSRKQDQLDLFACGNDGVVYTSWWTKGSDWPNNWKPLEGRKFPPGAKVTAVTQSSEQLDLFVCDADGCVNTSRWTGDADWSAWRLIGGKFPGGSDVTAVSRKQDQLDLFACGNDGVVYTSWRTKGSDWKNNWKPLEGRKFPPGAKVTAVAWSSEQLSSEQLDLFVCDANGFVNTSRLTRDAHWSAWREINRKFPREADVAAVTRKKDGSIDLFLCDNDGRECTFWWKYLGVLAEDLAEDTWHQVGKQSLSY